VFVADEHDATVAKEPARRAENVHRVGLAGFDQDGVVGVASLVAVDVVHAIPVQRASVRSCPITGPGGQPSLPRESRLRWRV
jgi:hypothetical protein